MGMQMLKLEGREWMSCLVQHGEDASPRSLACPRYWWYWLSWYWNKVQLSTVLRDRKEGSHSHRGVFEISMISWSLSVLVETIAWWVSVHNVMQSVDVRDASNIVMSSSSEMPFPPAKLSCTSAQVGRLTRPSMSKRSGMHGHLIYSRSDLIWVSDLISIDQAETVSRTQSAVTYACFVLMYSVSEYIT